MNNLTNDQRAALLDSADILGTEANELAAFIEFTLKGKLDRKDDIVGLGKVAPHRVTIAVQREMKRLRSNAEILKSLAEPEPTGNAAAQDP